MRTRLMLLLGGVAVLVMLWIVATSLAMAAASPSGDPVKGRYLFEANGGCGCHGPDHAGFKSGAPSELSGENFVGPFGQVAAANITSDKDTGVGSWTDDQLINALRNGIDDEGERLFPIMPYLSLHFMSDADVRDLVAYLRTLPAVSNGVPERKLNGPVPPVPALPPSPATSPTGGVDRGRYLVSAVSLCGDCHTPKTASGAPDTSKLLAGSRIQTGPSSSEVAPNLTSDKVTGRGKWTDQQLQGAFQAGWKPEQKQVRGLMAEQVAGGYNRVTEEDAKDIVAYLRSIPAVSNNASVGAGFAGGFATMSDLIPDIVGSPLEAEHQIDNGDVVQATRNGELVWRHDVNLTYFTDGATTWVNGPFGVQSRPNDQKLDWEP